MSFKDKIDSLINGLVEKKLDAVNPDAVKKKFADRKDQDIDNDGDVDSSDQYLHKRRKAISKAVAKEDIDYACDVIAEEHDIDDLTEQQLDELIGKVAKALYKGGQKIGQRLSTSGRADAAEKRAKALEKKKKDRERLAKAKERVKKAQSALRGESVELEEESKTIEKVRGIVDNGSYAKIGGVMVDLFTASAIIQIYDKVNDANKAKMDKMKVTQLADLAYKMMKRESVEELEEAPKIDMGKSKGSISAKGIRGKKMKKFDVDVSVKNGKFEFRITDEQGKFQTVGLKKAASMLGEETVADLTKDLEEKTECPKCEGKGCDHCDNTGYHEEKVEEAKNYEIKGGKIYISKANFRKVHKDYKSTTKGKERMMALDPKTGGSASFAVVFTESSFKEKFKRSLTKRLSESTKTEEKSDEVANRYNELKQMSPVELGKLYQKHYGEVADDMEKSDLISKIVDKEFAKQDSED